MPQSTPPSTFIPREVPTRGAVSATRGLGDLLVLLGVVIFIASVALAAGVFLYKQYLQSSAASKLQQLERAREAFEPTLIATLTRLDDRLNAAGEILSQHIAPTSFFHMLEQNTITNVGFTSLKFDADSPQSMNISMLGVAQSVNSIALQADVFSKGGVLTSPIFSDIDRQIDGVHFSLEALLNPATVNYMQLIATAAAGVTGGSPFDIPQGEAAPAPEAAVPAPAPAPQAPAPAPAPATKAGTKTKSSPQPAPAPAPAPAGASLD